jgi:hypothetical protein
MTGNRRYKLSHKNSPGLNQIFVHNMKSSIYTDRLSYSAGLSEHQGYGDAHNAFMTLPLYTFAVSAMSIS